MTLFTNFHRWGFIQFSTDTVNTTEFVRTPNWPVYSALVMIYDAQKVLYFISQSKTCSHLCSLAQQVQYWGSKYKDTRSIVCRLIHVQTALYICIFGHCVFVVVYNVQKFIAVNGYYTADLDQLEIPVAVRTGQCQYEPAVQVIKTYSFEATVSPVNQRLPVGHIRDDRLIWFTDRSNNLKLQV